MNAVKDALLSGGSSSGAGGLLGSAAGSDAVFGMATAGSGLFDNNCCNLSRKTRFQGFVGCFLLGCLISCMSTLAIYTFNWNQFAIFYTIGNLIALMSTMFLMGPMTQLRAMFHRKRILATGSYLLALTLTLTVAFAVPNTQPDGTQTPGKSVGIIALVAIQFVALLWYTLSYIPFARDLAVKMMGMASSRMSG